MHIATGINVRGIPAEFSFRSLKCGNIFPNSQNSPDMAFGIGYKVHLLIFWEAKI